ncbi:MAG: DNA-binding response regulator [Sorangiineae bacterium NIC37A_2]|jgi:two-component system phosphate regulon response regulator PhoB|nr:MAG: DNA-binding response regulator [Sorangiineae bacterium NIC37A_2]
MARIAVVEDEVDLCHVIEFNLAQAGHEVRVAESGRAGLELIQSFKPDLVLLDVMLPEMSGLEVCRQLKSAPETKGILVIMLTARGDEIDRVVGFEMGADDYVVKPFSVRELVLRVAALLRRVAEPKGPAETLITFGNLKLDLEAHRVWVQGVEVELTALEFRLLTLLYERRDRVQSRSTLLDVVWGISAEVTTRTVDTHVKRLREKLGVARDYIETVRGVGYRFVADPAEVRDGSGA